MPRGYLVIKEALKRALTRGELSGVIAELDDTESEVSWDNCTINRSSLVAWARKQGVAPKFLLRDILPPTQGAATSTLRELSIKCPEHLEPWIRLLLSAYEYYWANYDPNDTNIKSPATPNVIKDLMKQKINDEKIPQDAAKVFARIIRPRNAPTGRRRDTDDEKFGS